MYFTFRNIIKINFQSVIDINRYSVIFFGKIHDNNDRQND